MIGGFPKLTTPLPPKGAASLDRLDYHIPRRECPPPTFLDNPD